MIGIIWNFSKQLGPQLHLPTYFRYGPSGSWKSGTDFSKHRMPMDKMQRNGGQYETPHGCQTPNSTTKYPTGISPISSPITTLANTIIYHRIRVLVCGLLNCLDTHSFYNKMRRATWGGGKSRLGSPKGRSQWRWDIYHSFVNFMGHFYLSDQR